MNPTHTIIGKMTTFPSATYWKKSKKQKNLFEAVTKSYTGGSKIYQS